MRHKRLKLSAILLMGFGLTGLHAQEAVPASGGEATGSGGTVSYTAGQVVYATHSGASCTEAQGVQQTYSIELITASDETLDISLGAMVYPNPTTDYVKLQVGNQSSSSGELSYHLYSMSGVLMDSRDITQKETSIAMGDLGPATYILRVLEGSKEIKAFKIIKK